MRSISARLTALEQAQHNDGLVTAVFTEGSKRRLPLPDVIPLLRENQIVDITGDCGKMQGRLYDLLIGVIREPPGEVRL